eukprot:CAMPEP_0197421782 /NCGR_PEP_ID=MMETSP1170-20131217/11241_1 /TAXON_ID=54406 /ORGANISM="Sarcinochrysis sp, Strain CCMP770" /LENGTH=108 /DNA_ID=CAMNT_0042949063 /DNA_START=77 /DNA_END=400 /DNA_ORIENTATION=+
MSQRTLSKLEAEIARLEKELELYKSAQTKSQATKALREYVKENEARNDPFSSEYANPNPFHTPAGQGGKAAADNDRPTTVLVVMMWLGELGEFLPGDAADGGVLGPRP